MDIIITGCSGFIGSHLTKRLLADGHKVYGIDLKRPKFIVNKQVDANSGSSDKFTFFKLDIKNISSLYSFFNDKSINIEIIFHLAAKAGIANSIDNPIRYQQENVIVTNYLLEFVRQLHNRPKIVFASSSSVYGENKIHPSNEESEASHPISPYAQTKRSCELLLYTYHHLYHMDVCILRLFSVFGPEQRNDLVIYKFVQNIQNNLPVLIYGDGTYSRDFTYIEDIINGFIKSMRLKSGYNIFNIGTGKSISINDIIVMIEEILKKKAIKKYLPIKLHDVPKTLADISKAKIFLGYEPSFSFIEGLQRQIQWQKH